MAVIGAPGQYGQPLAGTDKGPQLLRDAGLHKNLAALGWRIEEMGDVVSQNDTTYRLVMYQRYSFLFRLPSFPFTCLMSGPMFEPLCCRIFGVRVWIHTVVS